MRTLKRTVLDKNFVINRQWHMTDKLGRGHAIRLLRKHGCTLRKDNTVLSARGETLVTLTDGTVQALAYHPKRGLAYVTRPFTRGRRKHPHTH
ncbi:MAG: hypothetical protein GY833_22930 [Aestuariibacter sp.]|nr:hypothetical protein [Aestuariibacter sp.]